MRRILALVALLALAGCRGGGFLPAHSDQDSPSGSTAGKLSLSLDARQQGGDYRLLLAAPSAEDLYQVAGTLLYDPQRYEVVAVESGGGLGDPTQSYFVSGETEQGRLRFAYTKRFWGEGASGPVSLMAIRVRPLSAFRLGDFQLDQRSGMLRVRNSRRDSFSVSVSYGEAK